MITVNGQMNRTPEGLPFSKRGLHLLREVGDVLRIVDVNHRTVRALAQQWEAKTGHRLAVICREPDPRTVWVLRTA